MAVGDFERIAERKLELNESITRCYDDAVSVFLLLWTDVIKIDWGHCCNTPSKYWNFMEISLSIDEIRSEIIDGIYIMIVYWKLLLV